jgi:hypothetical protein
MRNEEKGLITSTPVEIFIMAPGHHQVVEATLGLVHSVLGAEKKNCHCLANIFAYALGHCEE